MSKKFGKFILAATAVTTAAAAACYFMRKNKAITISGTDKDVDDFSDESVDDGERSYVELNKDTEAAGNQADSEKESVSFTSLTKQIKKTAGRVVGRTIEAVEEFFDDEDDDNDESSAKEEKTSEDTAEEPAENTAEEPISVKIEEDIVDAVKDAAKETPAEEAGTPSPAVQTEKDTVEAVQAEDNAAEETEVFLDEEDESDETK